jgi:hypothetical protein
MHFRTSPSRGALIGIVILLAPAPLFGVAAAASNGFNAVSLSIVGLLVASMACVVAAVLNAAAFLKCERTSVVLGLMPMWRTRVPYEEIAEASVVTIDAYAEFAGWGIKGSARSELGRLYSVGGSRAVRVRTLEGRTYLVAFVDADRAQEACVAVAKASGRDNFDSLAQGR